MSNISDMIAAAKQSRTVNSMPSQILPIFVAVNEALMDLQQRVEKLEGNILKDPNILSDQNILK